MSRRVLVLVTDAYGGRGGIAKFNRDLLGALCRHPEVGTVVALPRNLAEPPGALPPGLDYRTGAAGSGWAGRARYLAAVVRELAPGRAPDLVVSGHVNLLPLARAAARRWRVPLALVIHGIDAWEPPSRALAVRALAHVDRVISVSGFTRSRFLDWAPVEAGRVVLLPNTIDLDRFRPGPGDPALAARLGIAGRRTILTVARLDAAERLKGVDEVLQALGAVAREVPDIAYVIAGDGTDRARLEAEARARGLADRVIFAGHVDEDEKLALYRLADAYVMPSRGEGFGIVYLEAMACGLPVVASRLDAGREVLRDGALGIVVDPRDRGEVAAGILEALRRPKGAVPPALADYSEAAFERRLHGIVDGLLPPRRDRISRSRAPAP